MAKSSTSPKVDFYFEKEEKWQDEISLLRTIALECGLTEVLKWGNPCYTLEDNNVVLIHVFKEYCAFLFFKGALLNDPQGILIQQTKNVQAARQIRFTEVKEIIRLKPVLKQYLRHAMEVEKAGLKVEMKKTAAFPMPEEFNNRLTKNAAVKKAFYALTPGRQRGYLLYFSQPKQSATREARVQKSVKKILAGQGLND
jgi:uncharacterized protein YdeI (YjbR/CyaY-like superfamily)